MLPEPDRVKGPRLRTAIPVLVVGLALGIAGAIALGVAFWDVFTGPRYVVPGIVSLHLDSGTHIVFEQTGTKDSYGPLSVSHNGPVSIEPRQVTVSGPDGSDVRVRQSDPGESIDRDSQHYVAAVEFDAPRAGTYRLQFRTSPTRIIVQPPFGDTLRDNVGWILAVGIGGILFAGGMVMLIVGIVRRSSARRAATLRYAPVGAPPVAVAPTLPPAGWFPDPHRQFRLRYWDGNTWTDHTAD